MATTPTYIWKKSKYLCSIVYTHEMLEDKKTTKTKKKAPLHPRGLSLILKATPLPPPTPSAASAIRAWQPVLPARQPRRPQKLSHLTQPSAYLDVSFFFFDCFKWLLLPLMFALRLSCFSNLLLAFCRKEHMEGWRMSKKQQRNSQLTYQPTTNQIVLTVHV